MASSLETILICFQYVFYYLVGIKNCRLHFRFMAFASFPNKNILAVGSRINLYFANMISWYATACINLVSS